MSLDVVEKIFALRMKSGSKSTTSKRQPVVCKRPYTSDNSFFQNWSLVVYSEGKTSFYHVLPYLVSLAVRVGVSDEVDQPAQWPFAVLPASIVNL